MRKSRRLDLVKYWLTIIGSMWLSLDVNSQTVILHPDTFLTDVVRYHPLANRAALRNDMAAAELVKSKGLLDPSLNSNVQQKYFGGKDYYSLVNGELKIPTFYGIDFKTGYDLNRGVFLGPENSTPDNGLIYGGISLPLGQGLLIDERRATIRNARTGLEIGRLEEVDIKNELLYNASYQYWQWFRAFNILKILEEANTVASQRYDAVKNFAINGDRPSIDTIEAGIQVQNIRVSLIASQLDLQQSQNTLATFLWNENGLPTGSPVNNLPLNTDEVFNSQENDLSNLISGLNINAHPYLGQLKNKLIQLDTDLKMKKDKLKPRLNIQYNPLSEALGSRTITDYNINNYKWGLEFKMPLFLRKERGDVKLADIKIRDTELDLQQKTIELEAKLNNYIAEWNNTINQIDVFRQAVNQYRQMLEAERRLFDLGESSLFLINTREQAYIQANVKLTELIAKNRMAYYSIWYFAGRMTEILPD
ncbi:MAG: TolC family protein [Saprospiraceae bacterium]|nr:TolC family protein [Saprospiraceae bacterium]MBP6445350.1 TolC family protein [Saprospiraceae bacterium]